MAKRKPKFAKRCFGLNCHAIAVPGHVVCAYHLEPGSDPAADALVVATQAMATQAMGGQFAAQRWPALTTAKRLSAPELFEFRAWLQAQVDKEAWDVLVDAYGADVKPAPNGYRTNQGVKRMFEDLKYRIAQRVLDEAGFTGRRLWVLEFYAAEEAVMPKDEPKAAQVAEEAKDTRKFEYVDTPHGEFRKDSTLGIIYEMLARKGGATKLEIHQELMKRLPNESNRFDSMKTTINNQLSNVHMPTNRGFVMGRTAEGKYGIQPGKGSAPGHEDKTYPFSGITTFEKVARVETPERKLAREAKEKAKADAKAEKEKAKADKVAAKVAAEAAAAAAKAKADAEAAAAKAKADKIAAEAAAKATKLAAAGAAKAAKK